ncbi:hypothetical protein D3C76_1200610 [compost metagenome]
MLKRHIVEWRILSSLVLKYRNAYIQEEDLIEIIRRELGAQVKYTYRNSSDHTFAILAFLACETAERYLDLMTNEKSVDLLTKEVDTLRRARVQRYVTSS